MIDKLTSGPSIYYLGGPHLVLEFLLCLAAVLLVLLFGNRLPLRKLRVLDRRFHVLAANRARAVVLVFFLALAARLALLPVLHTADPQIHDEFSYLLAADTFASGRLTNPTPPFWEHFETFHVILHPTYMSMYQPGQGLVIAAGKVAGHPWAAILVTTALMCAALTWALQAWMPPGWALLGGLLAILRIGTFSYWVNSYWGGSLAALGGALVLGAYGRFLKRPQLGHGVVAGVGAVIMASTRPYEGAVLCLVTGIVLLVQSVRRRQLRAVLTRMVLPAVVLVACYAGWLGFYNYRVTGKPLLMAYTVNQREYAVAPRFFWQSPTLEKTYRHHDMWVFYGIWEFYQYRARLGFAGIHDKLRNQYHFYYEHVLFLPLLFNLLYLPAGRIRPLIIIGALAFLAWLPEVWLQSHYAAVAIVIFYALMLRGMRCLRTFPSRHSPKGLLLVWAVPLICLIMLGVRVRSNHQAEAAFPPNWDSWIQGVSRKRVTDRLDAAGGRHLVFVRYGMAHLPHAEWIYNAADLESAPIVWSREVDPIGDEQVIEHFRGRKVWLLYADVRPPRLAPYPMDELKAQATAEAATPNRGTGVPAVWPPKSPAVDSGKPN